MKNDIVLDITIPSHTRFLRMISSVGEKVADELDCPINIRDTFSSQLSIALTEGVVNAIKHANGSDPDKKIHIKINVSNKDLVVKIYDSGAGFDLEAIQPPSFNSNALNDKGRGIFIIRSMMDSVKYSKLNGGNVLEMRKKLA